MDGGDDHRIFLYGQTDALKLFLWLTVGGVMCQVRMNQQKNKRWLSKVSKIFQKTKGETMKWLRYNYLRSCWVVAEETVWHLCLCLAFSYCSQTSIRIITPHYLHTFHHTISPVECYHRAMGELNRCSTDLTNGMTVVLLSCVILKLKCLPNFTLNGALPTVSPCRTCCFGLSFTSMDQIAMKVHLLPSLNKIWRLCAELAAKLSLSQPIINSIARFIVHLYWCRTSISMYLHLWC